MIRLFRVSIPVSVVGLIVSEILLTCCCYLAAFLLLSDDLMEMYYLYEGGLERTAVVVVGIVLGVYFNDLYSEFRVISRLRVVQQFCLVVGMAFLSQALLSYVYPDLILPRWQMIFGSAIALVVLPVWRMIYDHLVLRVLHRQKVLFLGADDLIQTIASAVADRPEFGMNCVGFLSNDGHGAVPAGMGSRLGSVSALARVCEERVPDLIVVGLEERRGEMPVHDLLARRLAGTRVEDAANLYEKVMWRVPVAAMRPSQLLFSGEFGLSPRSLTLHRIYSVVIALVGVILALPVMAMVWLLVRLTSPGPAIYSQKRVGLNGKVFAVHKFRSMYVDAEARTGAVWASRNDPRITPVGQWIRKLRLDELPQFFNVLKGQMAIVGPRPERPEFVKVLTEQIPFYGQRHAVLPGITGWAQINHKYGDSIEDTITKLEYDLYYLKHMSLSLDMYIIFHTIKVMLLGRGSQ